MSSVVSPSEKKTTRQICTTVTVKKLFSNLPVRSKEFHRNKRKEYDKLISLSNAYAFIAKGVRLVCSNITGKNAKSVVLKTQGSGSLKDNIIQVFGMNSFSCLEPVSICISDGCKVEGFLSKSGQGSGRNLGDRQYFFVNGRPVDMPKVSKLVNELFKGANFRKYPIAIMNFIIPTRICSSLEKSNILSEQLPPAGINSKVSTREHFAEGNTSFRTVKINTHSLHVSEASVTNDHVNSLRTDLTLRVQGEKKVDGIIEANGGN
ncbi:hypothetical protein CRYUN_Cryun14cG0088000 [Craigia yunnanensis]